MLILAAPDPVPPHEPITCKVPAKDKPFEVCVNPVPKLATTPEAIAMVFDTVVDAAKVLVPEPLKLSP